MGERASGARAEGLVVIDTDVLIDHFRGVREASEFLGSIPRPRRAVTEVSVMELFEGARDSGEVEIIERFLVENGFLRLPITTGASRRAVELVKRFSLSHGLSIPDALIAGIVTELEGILITGNLRHFQFIPGLDVRPPPYKGPRRGVGHEE